MKSHLDKDLHELERRRHIDGFVNSFVDAGKRDRYRSFLTNPKKRSKILDRLNHRVDQDLIVKYVVPNPPRYAPNLIAYLMSDQHEFDDRFVEASKALGFAESASFGTIVSIVPGVIVALKMEVPATIQWLHRPERR